MKLTHVTCYSVLLVALAASAQQPASQPPKEQTTRTRVVLLGTGTPVPDPDRSGPATAIVVDDGVYLVDFGPACHRDSVEPAIATWIARMSTSMNERQGNVQLPVYDRALLLHASARRPEPHRKHSLKSSNDIEGYDRHNAGHPGSVESWLVSAGRDRRTGSPIIQVPIKVSET